MKDKTSVIFGNEIDKKTISSAEKSKAAFIKEFGDDLSVERKIAFTPIKTLDFLGAKNVVFTDGETEKFSDNALIVGNIRMGFGHYRISIAIASCAKALGFDPYWLDLASFDCTGSKMIRNMGDNTGRNQRTETAIIEMKRYRRCFFMCFRACFSNV